MPLVFEHFIQCVHFEIVSFENRIFTFSVVCIIIGSKFHDQTLSNSTCISSEVLILIQN